MARNTKRRRRKPDSDKRVKKKVCYFCAEGIDCSGNSIPEPNL